MVGRQRGSLQERAEWQVPDFDAAHLSVDAQERGERSSSDAQLQGLTRFSKSISQTRWVHRDEKLSMRRSSLALPGTGDVVESGDL